MARTFWDGADTYNTAGQIAVKWQVYAGVSLIAGRFAERAFRLDGAGGGVRICRSITPTDRHSIGLALRINGFVRPSNMGAGFYQGSTLANNPTNRQVGWCVDVEGRIIIYRGASTILWQSDPGVLPNNVWTYIGFSAVIHPSAGSVSLTVKGEQLIELTGINTRGLANDNINSVNIGMGVLASTSPMDVDDIYFDDEYLSAAPERRVETLRASGDIASSGFTASAGATLTGVIDETLLDTTDWMAGSLPGDFAEFSLVNLGNIPTVIDGVQAMGFASKTDAATRAVNYGIRSNGVDAFGSDIYLGSSVEQGWSNYLLNPDGNVAWNAAAVNALNLRTRIAV